jgi:hypothetical protein
MKLRSLSVARIDQWLVRASLNKIMKHNDFQSIQYRNYTLE